MKKGTLKMAIFATVVAGLFAFSGLRTGTVKGTVTPSDGALKVWVISQTDSFSANVMNGSFSLKDVKPGTYKIVVEAAPPYKNATKEAVSVKDGEVTDVGDIKLE